MMDLSIIIINFNTNRLTSDCIQSIFDTTLEINFEIIVIDNKSHLENPDEITQRFPSVKLIKNNENIGFGRANNKGISISKGDYVLFLNSDTIVLENCLDQSVRYMKKYAKARNIGLLGCHVLNSDYTNQSSTFDVSQPWKYFISSNPILSRVFSSNKHFDYTKTQLVVGVSGCFMLFDRSVFDKIKPFDPDFFMYAEETELCRNRLNKVFDCIYFADARIIHLAGGSSEETKVNFQQWVSYAMYRYKRGSGEYLLYLLSSLINICTLILLTPFFLMKTSSSEILKLKIYFRLIPYWIYHIPRYSRQWGARKHSLKVK